MFFSFVPVVHRLGRVDVFEIGVGNVQLVDSVYGQAVFDLFGFSVSLTTDGLLAVGSIGYASNLGALYTFRVHFFADCYVCVGRGVGSCGRVKRFQTPLSLYHSIVSINT